MDYTPTFDIAAYTTARNERKARERTETLARHSAESIYTVAVDAIKTAIDQESSSKVDIDLSLMYNDCKRYFDNVEKLNEYMNEIARKVNCMLVTGNPGVRVCTQITYATDYIHNYGRNVKIIGLQITWTIPSPVI
jgi:hypothetical protein